MKLSTLTTFLMCMAMSSAWCTQQTLSSDQCNKGDKKTYNLSSLSLAKSAGYIAFSITDLACICAVPAVLYEQATDGAIELTLREKLEASSAIVGFFRCEYVVWL